MGEKEQKEFAKALMAYLDHYKMVTGKSDREIAEMCNLSVATIQRLRTKPNAHREWLTIAQTLAALAPEAMPDIAGLKIGVKGAVKKRDRA